MKQAELGLKIELHIKINQVCSPGSKIKASTHYSVDTCSVRIIVKKGRSVCQTARASKFLLFEFIYRGLMNFLIYSLGLDSIDVFASAILCIPITHFK